jgi:hypothetical protein
VEPSLAPPTTLSVFVPHPESRLCTQLSRGSAIVGLPQRHGTIRILYEGNLFGAENLKRYRDRAAQAAARLVHNYPTGYPTIAKADVDPREVIEIGTIQPSNGRLEITARAEDLRWWIDSSDLEDIGASKS